MRAKLMPLEMLPCYLLVVCGKGNVSKKLDSMGIKYSKHEKEVEFVLDATEEAWALQLEKLHTPKNPKLYTSAVMMFWAGGVPKRNRGADTMAHEINHLKNLIFKHMGQRLNVNNDEFESYVVGYLTRKIYDVIRGEDPPRRVR